MIVTNLFFMSLIVPERSFAYTCKISSDLNKGHYFFL